MKTLLKMRKPVSVVAYTIFVVCAVQVTQRNEPRNEVINRYVNDKNIIASSSPFPDEEMETASRGKAVLLNRMTDTPKTLINRQHTARRSLTINRVAFVKTHKTGGSTFTNILNRFADIYQLEVAIPRNGGRFDWPNVFSESSVAKQRLTQGKADILSNHIVLELQHLKRVMKSSFKLVTILRNPVHQLYSVFYYENLHFNNTNTKDFVEAFFNKTMHSTDQNTLKRIASVKPLIKNGMSFDLNLIKNSTYNDVAKKIKFMDLNFDLVLINELYDEGLIVLKHQFSWKLMDIVYEKKLVNKQLINKNVSRAMISTIHKWNSIDLALYTYFRNKLLKKVLQFDQKRFLDELKNFRQLNDKIVGYCKAPTFIDYSNILLFLQRINEIANHEFLRRPYCYCKKLFRSELQYLSYFRRKYPEFHFKREFMMGEQTINGC